MGIMNAWKRQPCKNQNCFGLITIAEPVAQQIQQNLQREKVICGQKMGLKMGLHAFLLLGLLLANRLRPS